jgi:hypothetical protein
MGSERPLYLDNGKSAAVFSTSGSGQNPTHAVQQAVPYSMTSSALVSSASGTVRPSILAVLRLIEREPLISPRPTAAQALGHIRSR